MPARNGDLAKTHPDKPHPGLVTVPTCQAKASGAPSKGFDHQEVAQKLRGDYAHGARDPSIRHLDTLHALVKYLMKADLNLDDMLRQTALSIYTQFSIKEVSIALRSPSDGLYRYVAQHGMRADTWAAHNKITYTYDDIIDTRKWKPITVSHSTQLFLAEDHPYAPTERDTFSDHLIRESKRSSATASLEGDYIDIFIYGPEDEILGWIEITGTWDGKIPEARTIRCLEIVASVLGIAVTRTSATGNLQKPMQGHNQPK